MTTVSTAPRLVMSGLSGDSGKTLVALSLAAGARARGIQVRAFKKGPDYIDAAWLAWATGGPARNLDTFMAGPGAVARHFAARGVRQTPGPVTALNLIEGNRGLFDGVDAAGTHSTAALAALLGAPVILVINARKMTATAAALVRGCQVLGPDLEIGGVILNQVAGSRHEAVAREAIDRACGVPVLGAIPRLDDRALLPGRHLGLVPPTELPALSDIGALTRRVADEYLDVDALIGVAARSAEPAPSEPVPGPSAMPAAPRVRVGYVSDSAFSFYYPENLEALEATGADLVPVSSLQRGSPPAGLSALYIGGGFPETHAAALAANGPFLAWLRERAAADMPVYAECGGLMLLARSFCWEGRVYPMAGVLPIDVEVLGRPQGHGYVELRVDRLNPFFPVGEKIRGHEFHYSRLATAPGATACAVVRGTGCGDGRDAIVARQVWASYTHVHADGAPGWAAGLVGAARAFANRAGGVL